MEYRYLSHIDYPSDLKQLPQEALPVVCEELRDFIIQQLSQNPGHLGSSLGTVELTVALHYVFDTPEDQLVWDVGHQAYAHKILTGRRERFHTNRQFKGVAPFPTPAESEYDAFIAGHASNSISAALGMEIGREAKGERRRVVAVIGDGSMTGGLAFEGLNNASTNPNNLLIILNDNNMAIDPIKGGLSHYLTSIHYSKTYNDIRHGVYKGLKKVGLMSEANRNRLLRLGNSLKSLQANATQNNIFEGLNIRYFGPVDGHDVLELTHILSQLKNYSGPKVLHIITKKGKGYKPAEDEVTTWHAPGVFDIKTGERIKKRAEGEPPLFQEVFGHTLLELARMNEKIVGITPAMPSGCSMNIMMNAIPERTFDVGIAEGHAVTFSAGLAKEGLMPFCNIYSSFMQRAYDNVIHDVALQNLNVVFCLDRAGIVGNDGATHQGQFDLTMFRCIPNMTIGVPRNEHELRNLMYTAQQKDMGPFMIRYPRGKGILADWKNEMKVMEIGKGEEMRAGKEIAIVGVGPILYTAQKAIEQIEAERDDVKIGLYDLRFVKPLDGDLLRKIGDNYSKIYTIEDGTMIGGVGSAVEEWMMDNGYKPNIVRLGLPDEFVEHGSQAELYGMLGLDVEGIVKRMRNEE